MLESVHILDRQKKQVQEALIDMAACRGLAPVSRWTSHLDTLVWDIRIIMNSERWISLINIPEKTVDMASDIAHRLQSFVLALSVDTQSAWRFTAFNGNDYIGSYQWEISSEYASGSSTQLDTFEQAKLKQLGVRGLELLESRIRDRSTRTVSSDPRIEQHYRSRISGGQLDLPRPVLNQELPRLLHKITGLSTTARIRKILSEPHVNISGAVAEFGWALGLPDWLTMVETGDSTGSGTTADSMTIMMFDKKPEL
ncbi:hypothetical protein JW823_02380 [bacterium]|nr:hypothetical protein [candidate division CSSED10-310 bacterium]